MWRQAALVALLTASCGSPPRPPSPTQIIAPKLVVDAAPRVAPTFGEFPESAPFRLPHTFEPRAYRVRIAPGDKGFTGHIEIAGDLSEPTALLWLHGVDLVVTSAVATCGGETMPLEFSAPRDDQVLGLRARAPLQPGRWTLTIDYTGRIRDLEQKQTTWGPQNVPAAGLFRRVVDGETYLFTQGEAINARMIFPCIDEPDRKVPWQVTLDVAKELVVASNTPIQRETSLDATHKRVEFAETLPLPSYLIAFAIGPFDVVDAGSSKGGVPVRVLAEHHQAPKVAAMATATPQLLDKIADWVQVPYAYGKLDLVVVPKLGFGAMENPGLITITQYFVDHDGTDVIAHELAHQWFGDLVTLRWWDDIWLNESFATFVESVIDDPVGDPLDHRSDAFAAIGAPYVVRTAPRSNADLSALGFENHRVVHKGAGVLRLLQIYIGPERFRQALSAYVKAHTHGTVSTDDLIASLEGSTKMSLKNVVGTLLAGFSAPIETETQCKGKPRVHFHPFTSLPVCVAYDRDGRRDQVCASIDQQHPDVSLRAKACPRWVMPNAGAVGPYMVAWTPLQVHQLLTHGWASLTEGEKQEVFEETSNETAKLEVFVAHMREAGAHTFESEPAYLKSLAKFVPADLHAPFDAWVESHYAARARSVDLTEATATYDPAIWLLARIGDPDLAQAAKRIAPTYAGFKDETGYYSAIVTIRATTEPAFLAAVLDAALADTSHWHRIYMLEAIAAVPGVMRSLAADPERADKLEIGDLRALIGQACDPADRAAFVELIDDHPKLKAALTTFDQCVAQQKTMAPVLRRWFTH
jgi:hypothetical protein